VLRLGINRWSYPKTLELSQALEHAARIGYQGFEVAIYQEDIDVLNDPRLKEKWRRIYEEASSLGIEIPSVATGLYWTYNIVVDEHVDKALKVLEAQCRIAQILNAKLVLVVPGVGVSGLAYEDHFSKAIEVLKKMALIAKDYGIIIGLENVWNRVFAGPMEFAKLIDNVGEDNVKAYFDVGNTLPHSLPEHWIMFLKNRIVQIHVKDFNMAELRFGIPLTGDINWIEVRKAIEAIGYSGYIVAEVPPYRGDPFKASEDAYSSLKKIFG